MNLDEINNKNLPNLDWADSLRKNFAGSNIYQLYKENGDKLMDQRLTRSQNAKRAAKTKVKRGYFLSEAGKAKQSIAGKKGIKKTLEVERKSGYFESEKFKDQLKKWQSSGNKAQIENRKKSGFYQSDSWMSTCSKAGKIGSTTTAEIRKNDSLSLKKIIYLRLPEIFSWTDYLKTFEQISEEFHSQEIPNDPLLAELKSSVSERNYSIGKNHKHLKDGRFFKKIGFGKYCKINTSNNI